MTAPNDIEAGTSSPPEEIDVVASGCGTGYQPGLRATPPPIPPPKGGTIPPPKRRYTVSHPPARASFFYSNPLPKAKPKRWHFLDLALPIMQIAGARWNPSGRIIKASQAVPGLIELPPSMD